MTKMSVGSKSRAGMLRNAQNLPPERLLINRLNISWMRMANCASVIPFNGQRNIDITGHLANWRGIYQKALCIHLLIVLRSALNLPVLYGSAECRQRIAGLA